MIDVSDRYLSEGEAREFVSRCENDFDARLTAIAENICADKNLKIIGLSGPSCSGKTTTAKKLIDTMRLYGREAHIVSIDDFYHDRKALLERSGNNPNGEIDYDSIDTIDFDALKETVNEIFIDNDTTKIPKYDFMSGTRVGYVEIEPDENDVYIFEGIQAIYPQITKIFREHSFLGVYICVESGICLGERCFLPNEIRFLRRLVRDFHFRAATPEFTFRLWKSVRSNEEKNIFPYVDGCDVKINSALPCELNLLAPYVNDILASVVSDETSEYRQSAMEILNKLKGIQPFSASYLAENSLYREFI